MKLQYPNGVFKATAERASVRQAFPIPAVVFRHLHTKDEADQFAAGRCRLTTFKALRDPNHPRSDLDEGFQEWAHPPISIGEASTSTARDLRITKRLAPLITYDGPPENMRLVAFDNIIAGCVDAFLLCTSVKPDLTGFGQYCVAIEDPAKLMLGVGKSLEEQFGGHWKCGFGPVRYGRKSSDEVPTPYFAGTIGNEREAEWRFIWKRDQFKYPDELTVQVADVCGLRRFR